MLRLRLLHVKLLQFLQMLLLKFVRLLAQSLRMQQGHLPLDLLQLPVGREADALPLQVQRSHVHLHLATSFHSVRFCTRQGSFENLCQILNTAVAECRNVYFTSISGGATMPSANI